MSIDLGKAAPAAERREPSLRRCLGHFATGVAIVTYEADDGPRGVTINSLTSVSLDPPLLLVCLDKRSKAIGWLPRAPFAINVLHASQRSLAWHFAGKRIDGIEPGWSRAGATPRLSESLAWLACEPWSCHDAGDHIIIVGRISEFGMDADFETGAQRPLCFFRGEFVELPPRSQPASSV